MTPERAVTEVARVALETIDRGRQRGFKGCPTRLLEIVAAVAGQLASLSAVLDAEISAPGAIASMSEGARVELLTQVESAAMGLSIVYAHLPGVDQRKPRETH